MLADNNEVMNKAVFILRQMSADEKMREVARIRERALHDEASYREDIEDAKRAARAEARAEALAEGRAEGLAKGRSEGLAKGRSEGEKRKERTIVFNMFKTNQSNSLISAITGLSDTEIEKYRQEYENIHKI